MENTFSSYSSTRSLIRAEPEPPSKEMDSRDKLFLKNSFDFGRFKQINSRRSAPVNLTNIIDYSPNILCNTIDFVRFYCRFFKEIYLKNYIFLTLANYVKF